MMKSIVRWTAVALILVFAAMPVFAEGQGESAAEEGPMKITYVPQTGFGFTPENDTPVELFIEERFNVDLEPQEVDITNTEQYNLWVAQGGDADYWQTFHNNQFQTLLRQGVFREVSREMIYEHAPSYMKHVYNILGEELADQYVQFGGKYYGLAYGQTDDPYIHAARKDWMDTLGITETPATLDELEDLLTAFTFDDPDGNGKDDTYGICDYWGVGLGSIYAAYGIQPNTWDVENDDVVYTPTTEAFKNVLATLADWYGKGIIHPESPTMDRNTMFQLWNEGKIGVQYNNPWWLAKETAGNITAQLKEANPNAEVALFPAIKGPDGTTAGGFAWHPSQRAYTYFKAFGADVPDEKVIKVLEIWDALASDLELYLRTSYGEQGVDWEYQDGIVTRIGDASDAEYRNAQGHTYFGVLMLPDSMRFKEPVIEAKELAWSTGAAYRGINFFPVRSNDTADELGSDVTTIVDEYTWNVITGEVDLDATWSDYLRQLEQAGLSEIRTEWQEIYEDSK